MGGIFGRFGKAKVFAGRGPRNIATQELPRGAPIDSIFPEQELLAPSFAMEIFAV
jgi:hypothetical protein